MKVFHSGDWHIGNFKGPESNGVNLRSLDTKRCLESMAERAEMEQPELMLVPGDIFHTGKTWSDRCCDEVVAAIEVITRLSACSGQVIIMRGTPNHDGDGQFKVLDAHFSGFKNIHIVTNPGVVQTDYADIAVLPGFDRGEYRAKFPGLGKEEENEVFSQELSNIVMGLRTQCRPDRPSILMAHYTVPGCNTESGQSQILTQFEPIIPMESLIAAAYDLVALGHIHRPQALPAIKNAFYSGSINANNFNDEGQERGFWIHHFEAGAFGQVGAVLTDSEFVKTPYREYLTYHWTDTDITAIVQGRIDEVALNYWRWNGAVAGKIVRVLYKCSEEKHKALNTALIEKTLYEDGAFWVAGITPEKIESSADRNDLSEKTDPEANLYMYLQEKGMDPDDIERLVMKARPIIAEAMASDTAAAFSGVFLPLEIEVKNYRTYWEERFSFDNIEFCTINGQNGAGKSSLFMDAIIDCIFEEPREGKSTSVKVPWLRNAPDVRSGYISFTFAIVPKVYRITRTRAKSGKGTLNLAELVAGEWEDRSCEKSADTQAEIKQLIGVDSMTFKSCALIMQDQYGLFLEAKKEDRMVILGNLLGLSLYGLMEGLSKDKATDLNRAIYQKKQTIKVQTENILSSGKPVEELAEAEEKLGRLEQKISVQAAEKEKVSVLLNTQNAAKERYKKLTDSISMLTLKKRDTEQSRSMQKQMIAECDSILSEEPEVLSKAERYWELIEIEKQLIEGTTMYRAKVAEEESIQAEIKKAESGLKKLYCDLEHEKQKLAVYENQEEQEEVKRKAAEYVEKKEQLEQMYVLSQEFSRLSELRDRKAYEFNSKQALFNERERTLKSEQAVLEQNAARLADSGCIDIDNAKCRFLADAVEAKGILRDYPDKFNTLEKERDATLSELEKQLAGIEVERNKLGFSPEELVKLQRECALLKQYENRLKEIHEHESLAALISASINNMQSNISEAVKTLATLKLKAQRVTLDKEGYQACYTEHNRVIKEIADIKIWIEKEKQLPVARERKANAEKRVSELSIEIIGIEKELLDKQEQANIELAASSDTAELERQVNFLQRELEALQSEEKQLQISIGGLKQKIEEVNRMRRSIQEIHAELTVLSEDAADYEALKLSFSQDGIPHQIIRTILPKLSTIANNILGQMTGGQLGVSFQTEKTIKSNNKKEVVTLDILIEEYGKSTLPYLSKSGGEKVKASLSVILALAEIKASTAGIQFGMLFVDEPPFLDADGIQAYCDALETIRARYGNIKIMAITHDPTMKSRFPQNLDVIKTEKGSKVIY